MLRARERPGIAGVMRTEANIFYIYPISNLCLRILQIANNRTTAWARKCFKHFRAHAGLGRISSRGCFRRRYNFILLLLRLFSSQSRSLIHVLQTLRPDLPHHVMRDNAKEPFGCDGIVHTSIPVMHLDTIAREFVSARIPYLALLREYALLNDVPSPNWCERTSSTVLQHMF